MTKQIRKKVFETNSSSSHSLTMSSGDLVKRPFAAKVLRAGVIELTVGEYHWEWRRYYEPAAKLAYLLTQITGGELPAGDSESITAQLREDNERFAMLEQVVLDHTGCKLLVTPGSGGIDHQSGPQEKGVGLELFNNADTLRDFLFKADSYIETGNDNSPAPWEIMTDRGRELYYAPYITEVPDDYVSVKLTPLHNHRSDGFATGAGGVVTPTRTPKLHAGLLKSAIIASAHWECRGYYNDFENREVRGYSAAEASCGGADYGFKLAPNFTASYDYQRGEGYDKQVTFVARVPRELAEQLAALDPKGYRDHQLAEAVRMVKQAVDELKKQPAHHYYQTQLAEARAKVLKLGGKKALAALPTVTPAKVVKAAPAKKAAVKKVAAKKAPAKKTSVKKTAP